MVCEESEKVEGPYSSPVTVHRKLYTMVNCKNCMKHFKNIERTEPEISVKDNNVFNQQAGFVSNTEATGARIQLMKKT